jgi:DnaJ-class molecular chaperone
MQNHYDILGVSREATDKEIKQAYRALSMKYHPDKTDSSDAHIMMQQINEAYSVLGDAEQRQRYNMELDHPHGFPGPGHGFPPGFFQGFQGQGFQGQGFPPGLFEMLFSNGGGPEIHFFHSFAKPPPLEKPIEITLQQSYTGITVEVPIDDASMSIHIPAGINDGNNIIIAEKGHIVNGHRGDLHLLVRVTNNTPFIRQGNNLVYAKKVSLKEALCGFKFHIDHLNGNKLGLNINAIVYPGAKQVIKNLGFPSGETMGSRPPGDLIIEFTIEFPEHLTQQQKDTIASVL